jgi:hypothetical protein
MLALIGAILVGLYSIGVTHFDRINFLYLGIAFFFAHFFRNVTTRWSR